MKNIGGKLMGKSPAFQFYPKQWLGDDLVMLMDWDARAMHMHYMCIAWQQTPACTLPNDDEMLRKWVGNPEDWSRIKTQVFRAWKLEGDRWVQAGLLAEYIKQKGFSETRRKAADARWDKDKAEKNNARALHTQSISNALQSSSSTSSSKKSAGDDALFPISPQPEGITPLMVTDAVLKDLRMSGKDLRVALADVCRDEMALGTSADELRALMVKAWTDYDKDRAIMECPRGAKTFFGEGFWRNRKGWKYLPGHGSKRVVVPARPPDQPVHEFPSNAISIEQIRATVRATASKGVM